jgi:hypothetical protein
MIAFATGMLLVVVFVLGAAVMLRLGIRVFREARQEQLALDRATHSLGFAAVDDAAFATKLATHFREPTKDRPWVCGLLKQPGPGYTKWMFHLSPPAHGAPHAVAIQSPHLNLPRFSLVPALSQGQASAAVASDRYLHELMCWDDPPVRHPMIPLDGTHHTLSAPSVAWVEPLFSPEFRAWLSQTEGLALSGEGDLLVIRLGWTIDVSWAPVLERNPEKGLRFAETCYRSLRKSE